eukprot:7622477-Lingulodinium_polyedra.AAC.1
MAYRHVDFDTLPQNDCMSRVQVDMTIRRAFRRWHSHDDTTAQINIHVHGNVPYMNTCRHARVMT